MVNWLRHNFAASLFLTIVRIGLGFYWLFEGIFKLTSNTTYSAKNTIQDAINNGVQHTGSVHGQVYPLWTDFLKFITNNGENTGWISFIVIYGSILIGILLILGLLTIPTTLVSLIVSFIMMISNVVSYNPIIFLLSFIVLISGFNATKLGIDRWLTPWFRLHLPFLRSNAAHEAQIEKIIG